jgi:HAD superfamily hydrolase (TIGR01484 family)
MMMQDVPTRHFKALFTDLDGTAIPNHPDGFPSSAVIQAMKAARTKAFISVATGRPINMCAPILDALGVTNPCVVNGGTQIVDPVTRKVIWEQALSPSSIEKILDVCSPYTFIEEGEDALPQLPTATILTGNKLMMAMLGASEEEANKYYTQLNAIPEIMVLKVHSWAEGKWDLHISHIGASKRHALEVLLGMLELDAHEVIAVGDSQNDVPLFEAAGYKVAMGNAVPELKAMADYIAPSVGEDGLAHVINTFIV